jgi:hypothetical protein
MPLFMVNLISSTIILFPDIKHNNTTFDLQLILIYFITCGVHFLNTFIFTTKGWIMNILLHVLVIIKPMFSL